MRIGGNRSPGAGGSRLNRLLIFLFFVTGSATRQLARSEGLPLEQMPASLPYLLSFGAALVLSASVLGIALLPVCAFAFGSLTGSACGRITGAFLAGGEPEWVLLLASLVSVPVFFLLCVRGMATSQLLGTLLDRSDYSVRTEYNRAYLSLALTAFAGITAVCLIVGYS